MLEIMLAVAVVVAMAKIAEADDQSVIIWTLATILLCIAAIFFAPAPYARVLVAGLLAFLGMFAYKTLTNK